MYRKTCLLFIMIVITYTNNCHSQNLAQNSFWSDGCFKLVIDPGLYGFTVDTLNKKIEADHYPASIEIIGNKIAISQIIILQNFTKFTVNAGDLTINSGSNKSKAYFISSSTIPTGRASLIRYTAIFDDSDKLFVKKL